MTGLKFFKNWKYKNILLEWRWIWHLFFWLGYAVFRFWSYYITIHYNYPPAFLEYMLLSEVIFVAVTYFTLWLYRRLFYQKKYFLYFLAGVTIWLGYLYGRTIFQFWYLESEPRFRNNSFSDIIFNNITVVIVYFLFITSSKFFKDGFISQYYEAERKKQQLMAEVSNLKSQIAPHFLFNTLNNLYGLAVEKSDKLPGLMLRLSDLLRHSLYETQKPLVPINEEINVLKSYIELESVRLEDDLKLEFDNSVPDNASYQVAPLILIVFIENAFKHAKFVQTSPVIIEVNTMLEDDWFRMTIRNNYNSTKDTSSQGIGLVNVKRRLDLLYPNGQHELSIIKDDQFFTVYLHIKLEKG